MTPRIVFACSGSPDSYAAIPWLATHCGAEVVTVTLDAGRGRDLEGVRRAALAAGAVRAHVVDVRDECARVQLLEAVSAGSADGSASARLPRPLIAETLIAVARREQTTLIAHGGDPVDHLLIAGAAQATASSFRVIAAPSVTEAAKDHSVRASTVSPTRGPSGPAHLEISFESGLPVAVNGVPMTLAELVESVSTIASNHGVGYRPETSRAGVVEAPAAVVLHAAHAALGADAMGAPDATVHLEVFQGRHRILSASHS